MDNVIDCRGMDAASKENVKQMVRDLGPNKTIEILINVHPTQEVYIKALVKNIIKRWKKSLGHD